MITHEEEKGRVKCAKYWPPREEASETYGNLTVKLVKVTHICEDYLLREFLISSSSSGGSESEQSRRCFQFQYLAWSDHGVPENAQNTLSFIDHFNKIYNQLGVKKPVTVHCSAGIGRTGAIIVIDTIIDRINTYGVQTDIDVKAVYYFFIKLLF